MSQSLKCCSGGWGNAHVYCGLSLFPLPGKHGCITTIWGESVREVSWPLSTEGGCPALQRMLGLVIQMVTGNQSPAYNPEEELTPVLLAAFERHNADGKARESRLMLQVRWA